MSLRFIEENKRFKELIEALRQGEKGLKIGGLIGSAKPYFLSVLKNNFKKRIVFIRSFSSPLESFEEQSRFYLNQFSPEINLCSLPPLSENPYQRISPSLDTISTRMRFFYHLIHEMPSLIITNIPGLLKPFPSLSTLQNMFLNLEVSASFQFDRLLKILSECGYLEQELVNSPGEYARRGGIIDVFSFWENDPFRIEFSGDEIVSLRKFDPSNQRSIKKVNHILIPSLKEYPGYLELEHKESICEYQALNHKEYFVPFTHYLNNTLFVVEEVEEVEREWREMVDTFKKEYRAKKNSENLPVPLEEIYNPDLWEEIKKESIFLQSFSTDDTGSTFVFPFQSIPQFKNRIPFFLQYLKKLQSERERCFVFFSSEGVCKKIKELLFQHNIVHFKTSSPFEYPKNGSIGLVMGEMETGFRYPEEKVTFFSEKDIITEEKIIVKRKPLKKFLSHFQDFKTGDYIVHIDYGVGIFNGLVKMNVSDITKECMEITYKDNDKLFVPVEDLNLVQKYSRAGSSPVVLNKLGSASWEKTKARTKKSIENIARGLLQLYAQRKAGNGYGFSQEGNWQEEFDKTFEYSETEDQLKALKDIKKDMESEYPMDRLLCGDVGFGKTEVAMRASFKAVMDGKQVGVLCPTTVLASQHLKTFKNRMLLFPVRVESLTRLKSKKQQKKIVEDLKKGKIDILIGTHRILSNDVQFRDLGLLIIDEEQRFGVSHKEKIKKMKTSIDVLTLTATPIPRTLNLSLTGIRDISLIESPPRDRLSINTIVAPFSMALIASSIKKELAREGQVYFIHNKIDDIDRIAQLIKKIDPDIQVAVIHGKMPSLSIEKKMIDFIERKYDVLVSTTIIENGIDIPLVNTLIVNNADHFGLAQLYQLRGRVGRSSRQAIAYFLVPSFTEISGLARKRLKALQEFSQLGSGFRLAAKDLEIRGAGNFLGAEQHGYIEAVGFDYYMHLLYRTIKELKGEKEEDIVSEIHLRVDIKIPEDFIPQMNLRLDLYKRVSSIQHLDEIETVREEIKDRYGDPPRSFGNLLRYGAIKYLAQKMKITSIDRIGKRVIFKFFPGSSVNLSGLTKFIDKYSGSITPQGVMSLLLSEGDDRKIMDETITILKELSIYNIIGEFES